MEQHPHNSLQEHYGKAAWMAFANPFLVSRKWPAQETKDNLIGKGYFDKIALRSFFLFQDSLNSKMWHRFLHYFRM